MANENLTQAQKSGFMAAFAVATTWFGTHVGGGFASGNQVVSYFSQYGTATAFLFPLCAMALLAVVITIYLRFAKVHGFTTYKDTFNAVYPNPKMEILFEIFYISVVLAAVAAAVTGAGNVLCNFLGIDYTAGNNTMIFNLLIVVILIILTNFGIKLVIAASAVLSALIIIICIAMVVFGLTVDYNSIAATVSAANAVELGTYTSDFANALWRGVFVYCGFQCVSIPAMISAGADLDLKGATKAGIIGGFLNGIILALSGLMLGKWYPLLKALDGVEGFGATLRIPNQTVLNLMGIKWLLLAFSVLCFCAFMSTCVTLVYTLSQRFQVFLIPNTIKSERARGVITGIIIIAICFAISLLGLSTIVSKFYAYDGYLSLVVVVIPGFIWALPKTAKKLAELKAAGKEV